MQTYLKKLERPITGSGGKRITGLTAFVDALDDEEDSHTLAVTTDDDIFLLRTNRCFFYLNRFPMKTWRRCFPTSMTLKLFMLLETSQMTLFYLKTRPLPFWRIMVRSGNTFTRKHLAEAFSVSRPLRAKAKEKGGKANKEPSPTARSLPRLRPVVFVVSTPPDRKCGIEVV